MPLELEHDGMIWISTGHSREEKSWKNKQMLYSELCQKLTKAVVTNETAKEYKTFTPEQKDQRKDVGGFVGGPITGGRRKKGAVGSRSLVTLDIDFADSGFWDSFSLFYGCAAFVYATHSSTPDKPRLRLIVPLATEILADQYEPIARRIAGTLGIEAFDDTTYQASRLMYWPSVSKDVKYFCAWQDGPWLDPQEVLSTYRSWKDSSQWPMSTRAKAIPRREIKKAGDPLEKPGVIGAFCRTYTIAEAIDEYLSDVYEATDDDDRYSFMQGSTSKGLVIYDDVYAYSHHGTDPASGRLLNAFDLVRVHLYELQDEDAAADTPINRKPSTVSMKALCEKDKAVKLELIKKRSEGAADAFADLPEDAVEPEIDFRTQLDVDKAGGVHSTIQNAVLILKNDPRLKGCFAHNSFAHQDVALKDLPWRSISRVNDPLTDDDDACLRGYIERVYGPISREKVGDGFRAVMVEHSFHPVRDYLNGLTWDKTERIDSLLIDYFGTENTDYSRMIIRKTLVGAVARVFDPGIKFENVLVLVGDQGTGKSTFFDKLGGEWFSDSLGDIDKSKESMESVQGKWIIEIGELAALTGKVVDKVKHFIGKRKDYFRPAFGRRNTEFERQCIFVATTNKQHFLNDPTGDRRWWPIKVDAAKRKRDPRKDLTAGQIRQIWAEAVELYKQREPLFLTDDQESSTEGYKKQFKDLDPREPQITAFLSMPVPDEWYSWAWDKKVQYINEDSEWSGTSIYKTTTEELWRLVFHAKVKDMKRYETAFIRDYFTSRKDWKSGAVKMGRETVWGFIKTVRSGRLTTLTADDIL